MATCSERGQGWSGNYPNCVYNPGQLNTGATGQDQFTGTVESLGYGTELAGSTFEQDWEQFFDPYEQEAEERLTTAAGVDIGQLESAWDLEKKGFGKQWAGKMGQLSSEAQLGMRKAFGLGRGLRGGSGLAYSGTAAERERTATSDVLGSYRRSFGLGKSAYEQAMETGALRLGQATTDIYQGLEQDVYGLRDAWKTGQRSNLNTILGMDIWGGGTGLPGGGSEQEEWEEQNQTTCCDGETVQMAALCGPGNMPGQCDDTGNDSGGNPPGDTNPCPDSDFSYQCPDGTCVNSQLECLG